MKIFKRKLPYIVLTSLSAGRRVKNIYVKNEPATNDTDRSPVIIAANHTNSHDMPILLKAYGGNAVFLLGKQRLGLLDWLFFWLNGAVFTDRLDRKDTGITKKVLIELLKNRKTIVWFPEGTWNMTENLPMLPMKWGIIEVAREAGADILPAFLSYCNEKEACSVQFGKAMRIGVTKDQLEAINELRDALASLFWNDLENKPIVKREQLNKKEEQKRIWSYVEEYPPIQWEYERKCIFSAKGNTQPDEAFAFMTKLVPSRANAFLFDKRNKF